MNNYTVMLTDKATDDIRDIYRYICYELYDDMAANAILNKFEDAIRKLSIMPKRHLLIKDIGIQSKNIRRVLVENYVIFYLCEDKDRKVKVVRVLYNKRNWIDLI